MATFARPQWRLEMRSGVYPQFAGDPHPREEWVPLRSEEKRYTFVEHHEAETVRDRLQRVQPHAVFRIMPM